MNSTEKNPYFPLMTSEQPVYDCKGNDTGKMDTGSALTQAAIDALPVANSKMTSAELRQLCLDYFKLHLSFQWVPKRDIPVYSTGSTKLFVKYLQNFVDPTVESFDKYTGKALKRDTIHEGIPYHNLSSGNIYRWMEYYDEKTGEMDLAGFIEDNGGYDDGEWLETLDYNRDEKGNLLDEDGALCTETDKDPVPLKKFIPMLYDFKFERDEESGKLILQEKESSGLLYPVHKLIRYTGLKYLFTQCSIGSSWGWARVVNSANFAWTTGSTVFNGFIPVGGFTYEYEYEGKKYGMDTIDKFGVKNEGNPLKWDTKDVARYWIEKHGENAMFDCYAKLKPADCVVSGGHVMMVRDVHVVRDEKGQVDPLKSYITVFEQFNDAYAFVGYLGKEKAPYLVHGGYVSDYDDAKSWTFSGDPDVPEYELYGARVFNFAYLQGKDRTSRTTIKNSYLPFTFAEFHYNNDSEESKAYMDVYNKIIPVAGPATAYDQAASLNLDTGKTGFFGVGVEEAEIITNLDQNGEKLVAKKSISIENYKNLIFAANYTISDVFVTVTDPSGKILKTLTFRSPSSQMRSFVFRRHKTPANESMVTSIVPLADGKNTLKIAVQLGNGQKIDVFCGTIFA